jgi:hypothetical protein
VPRRDKTEVVRGDFAIPKSLDAAFSQSKFIAAEQFGSATCNTAGSSSNQGHIQTLPTARMDSDSSVDDSRKARPDQDIRDPTRRDSMKNTEDQRAAI